MEMCSGREGGAGEGREGRVWGRRTAVAAKEEEEGWEGRRGG